MKLAAEDIALFHRRREVFSVFGGGDAAVLTAAGVVDVRLAQF